jgi:hypothetical protein
MPHGTPAWWGIPCSPFAAPLWRAPRRSGFHNIPALDAAAPALITAVQPAYDLGRLGARRLIARIAGLDAPPADILLPTKIRIPPLAATGEPLVASVAG